MSVRRTTQPARTGFTVLELVLAVAMLGVLLTLVAQAAFWSHRERLRGRSRQAAQELTANVLEAARAQPWDTLTPEWAGAQKIPAGLEALLPDARLEVRVAPEPKVERVKRVTVEVRWLAEEGAAPRSERLTGLFSERTPPTKESP